MEMYKPRAYKQQFMVWCEFQTKKTREFQFHLASALILMIFLSSVCQLVKCCSVCTDYVDTMKKLLFSLTDAERKEVLEKYSLKQPEPLNRQFLERKSKEEAGKDYRARQQMSKTTVVPSG